MNEIRFFLANDTDFSSQGENILPLTKCLETKVDNEDWYVEVDCPLKFIEFDGLEHSASEWIYQGAIIVVPTNGYGDQPFKINNPSQEDDVISFRARHIGYSSENYMLRDVYPQNLSCQAALDWIIARTVPASPFTAYSDYAALKSSRHVRVSLLATIQALHELYGGHIDFDEFQIRLTSTIGSDKGESIEYGVSLEGATITEDWKEVVTTLLPVGKEGLTLDETFLYADVSYADPFVKTQTFDVETKEELRIAGQAYLDANKLPKINYNIQSSMVIGGIGDTVSVNAATFSLQAKILSYTSDRLLDQMVSVEFGNFRKDAKAVFSNIQAALKDLGFKNEDITTMVAAQTDVINNLFQFGHAVHTADATYYVDQLPKENAQQVMMLSMAGIGFSSTGINGPFYSAWTLDKKFNADNISGQTINVANANVAGVLTVGVHRIEKYDANTTMIRMI